MAWSIYVPDLSGEKKKRMSEIFYDIRRLHMKAVVRQDFIRSCQWEMGEYSF